MVKIKNINKRSQNGCSCGSWLKHWEKFSGQRITYCPVDGCLNKDLAGTPVQKADGDDQNWFIFPLCGSHSRSTGELVVAGAYTLVSAEPGLTCGKPSR
jgi:hypothetical protein